MGTFDCIIAAGLGTARKVTGKTVTYRRGNLWFRLNGAKGVSDFQSTDVKSVQVEYRSTDWLFSSCDLKARGIEEPRQGDQVEETIDGKTYTYQVGRDGAEQPWRYSDAGQSQIRVHSKLVSY